MVVVVTTRSPVVGGGATQLIVKSACPVPPAGTDTFCGFASFTVQLDGTPTSVTEWSPAASVEKVT